MLRGVFSLEKENWGSREILEKSISHTSLPNFLKAGFLFVKWNKPTHLTVALSSMQSSWILAYFHAFIDATNMDLLCAQYYARGQGFSQEQTGAASGRDTTSLNGPFMKTVKKAALPLSGHSSSGKLRTGCIPAHFPLGQAP